jgi:hypothetical protein
MGLAMDVKELLDEVLPANLTYTKQSTSGLPPVDLDYHMRKIVKSLGWKQYKKLMKDAQKKPITN